MEGRKILDDMDSTQVTDAERAEHGVSTLAEQRERLKWINKKQLFTLYIDGMSVEDIIALCKKEGTKEGEYNITKKSVNRFAYQLEEDGKQEAALKVFTLNTELYPDVFKTY